MFLQFYGDIKSFHSGLRAELTAGIFVFLRFSAQGYSGGALFAGVSSDVCKCAVSRILQFLSDGADH